MKRKEKVEGILTLLDEHYGPAKCYLNHETAWQLLIATILSAQCTDDRVNIVTKDLFQKYLKVKNLYENDKYLCQLKEKINLEKKQLSKLHQEELFDKIREIKKLEDEYDNYPIYVTYLNLKTRLENLVSPLKDIFK